MASHFNHVSTQWMERSANEGIKLLYYFAAEYDMPEEMNMKKNKSSPSNDLLHGRDYTDISGENMW